MASHDDSTLQEYHWDPMYEDYGIEDMAKYNKGGFHPVHLGDVLDDRFQVVHKLGSGGFGTVWLCRDQKFDKWRAVKIIAASQSDQAGDLKVIQHLRSVATLEDLEQNYIATPLEEFWLEGPNGRHLCFIMPIMGCAVSTWRSKLDDGDEATSPWIKAACRQITKGVRFLHEKGVCHNDLRPNNILIKLDQQAIQQLDKEEMVEILGEPDEIEVETTSGADPRPIAPEYCVAPATFLKHKNLFTDQIAIVDFGESFLIEDPRSTSGIPPTYAAPEVLLGGSLGPGTDIWSLACTFYNIQSKDLLLGGSFYGSEINQIVHEIETFLGPLPQEHRALWDEKEFEAPSSAIEVKTDDETEALGSPATCSMGALLATRNDLISGTGFSDVFAAAIGKEGTGQYEEETDEAQEAQPESNSDDHSREEILALSQLLRKMMKYSPEDRIDTSSILVHPWLSDTVETETSSCVDEPAESDEPRGLDRCRNAIQRLDASKLCIGLACSLLVPVLLAVLLRLNDFGVSESSLQIHFAEKIISAITRAECFCKVPKSNRR
ncbi:hypothetical protein JX265_003853 [Neoarthrinium moseri]|uniref:EKC/KEOPS complex subunit BUD32 n=1 Tax=Neoarthrinium moseri TaxID=1658444 RepID=A0A9P9WR73_9PEZI|nr:uncharacterized protein JN550_009416 [Neoarthrinium moseri]KAI1863716.1 hypothetical protein JN550_009416 [Neoarthrinium moseri]KAI1876327.1 hypothetical protein JX265_003853 [Neoarthrinium moseri]